MLINFIIHIAIGIFGSNYFGFNRDGLVTSYAVAFVIQGVDMFRFYTTYMNLILSMPPETSAETLEAFKRRAPITMPQAYLMKVILYGTVTLIASAITN